MSSNFGVINKDVFAKTYYLRGSIVVDEFQNIYANSLHVENSLILTSGNLIAGNLHINQLIAADILQAPLIIGNVIHGTLVDLDGEQVVGNQQSQIPDPPSIAPFFPQPLPAIIFPPAFPIAPLTASGGPPPAFPSDSVDHIFLFNIVQLQNDVKELRQTVTDLLAKLRNHGLIAT